MAVTRGFYRRWYGLESEKGDIPIPIRPMDMYYSTDTSETSIYYNDTWNPIGGASNNKNFVLTRELTKAELLALHTTPINIITVENTQHIFLEHIILYPEGVAGYDGGIKVSTDNSNDYTYYLSSLTTGKIWFDVHWYESGTSISNLHHEINLSAENSQITDTDGSSESIWVTLSYKIYDTVTKQLLTNTGA